ncbi:MAG: hypothetical protein UV02_C0019G0006 [Candidatus Kuenenbacteria bacterium GW2011_GWA2_42_15]|uniref:Uncharacterized protein n=1 Tax=Candidatus Kuenenbacteria bacterium GW2011_GWA2_42_15 TaxID=1618677 RepID=A0A0G0Z0K1_9BACT|nr:MAG: hypothetical protein UV02_C0019G0006 [Candidatus Kuenenbacteria bacterium GW2011_GWA2_42_15]
MLGIGRCFYYIAQHRVCGSKVLRYKISILRSAKLFRPKLAFLCLVVNQV